jgi:hypothetical protein
MRKALSIGLATFLMASPALAQVVIGGDNDAVRHEQRSQQDRMQAHRDSAEAHRDAATGNYGAAAREQREAHQEWRDSHHQQRAADRDANGVRLYGH